MTKADGARAPKGAMIPQEGKGERVTKNLGLKTYTLCYFEPSLIQNLVCKVKIG